MSDDHEYKVAGQKVKTSYQPEVSKTAEHEYETNGQKVKTSYKPEKDDTGDTQARIAAMEERKRRIEENYNRNRERQEREAKEKSLGTRIHRFKDKIVSQAKSEVRAIPGKARAVPGKAAGFAKEHIKQSYTDFLKPSSPSTTKQKRKQKYKEKVEQGQTPSLMDEFWNRPAPKKQKGRPPSGILDSVSTLKPSSDFLLFGGQRAAPRKRGKKGRKRTQPVRDGQRDPWDFLL